MKFIVKTAGLIIALFMVFGTGAYFANEIMAQGKTYKVGDKGPAGGWIFYDKGNNSGGWRYLEAAPEDQGEAAWGCDGTSIPGAGGTAIGTGKANTAAIIKNCGEPGIAAKVAVRYRGGGKSDWFLPSQDELHLLYENLRETVVGGGVVVIDYWSSSEYNANYAGRKGFAGGYTHGTNKSYSYWVRAIRTF